MTVQASVLIPTHDRPETLRLAVASVLNQTVSDLEVIIIGIGATESLRAAALDLVHADTRVSFLDRPMGSDRGEIYRHEAILAAQSDAIFYLCDDDLLLPEHVADLLELLESHNFVQSLNGYITPDGTVEHYPTDLAQPASIAQHLRDDIRYNSVSLTGTAHSRLFYNQVADPWSPTPAGQWPDHYQWRKMMRHPAFSGATSKRMTALQFPLTTDERNTWTAEQRRAEIERWAAVVASPGGQETIDELVVRDTWGRMEKDRVLILELDAKLAQEPARIMELNAELERVYRSKSWRYTRALRAIRLRLPH
ncbi:MAG: glycosyltransferase family 2 protein [Salinibacterium sp.]|nr:MAG: glycosyltransferase family 2 protein [Salinibacterium sp.]